MVTLFPLFVHVHVHVYNYIHVQLCVYIIRGIERERKREGGGCYRIGLSMSACIIILLDNEYLTCVYLERARVLSCCLLFELVCFYYRHVCVEGVEWLLHVTDTLSKPTSSMRTHTYLSLSLSLSPPLSPSLPAERKVILGKDWHSHCLRCDECDKPLTPGQHSAVSVAAS